MYRRKGVLEAEEKCWEGRGGGEEEKGSGNGKRVGGKEKGE